MLGYYTRDFRSGHVEAAVDYLTLICLNADVPGALGKVQAELCHEALRELVLETREFAQLLGDIQSDGTRIKGLIEERLKLIHLADQEDFLRTVTIQAARMADDSGRTTDAVLLYHLAEEYDNVITIINRALSEAIAVEIGEDEMQLQPLKPRVSTPAASNEKQQASTNSSLSLTSVDEPTALARNMISLYNTNALYYQKIRPANRDACGILLRLSEVKVKVSGGQWAEALDVSIIHFLFPRTIPPKFQGINRACSRLDDRHLEPPPFACEIIHPDHPFLRTVIQRTTPYHLTQHRAPAPLDHYLHRPSARDPRVPAVRGRNQKGDERRAARRGEGFDGVCRAGQISSWGKGVGSDHEMRWGRRGVLLMGYGIKKIRNPQCKTHTLRACMHDMT
jgi:hypothetical protein